MSKKLSLTLTAIIATIGLTTFSISNAFALNGESPDTAPLTSAKQLCQEAKDNYKKDIAEMNEKGISLQMTTEQLAIELKEILKYKNKICKEAKKEVKEVKALTSAVQLCQEAKDNYKKDIANMNEKGISLQMTPEQLAIELKEILKYKNKLCQDAKKKTKPLTSAVQLCKESKDNYKKNIADMKEKGISLQLTTEQLAIELKEILKYKNKICKEAKKK